MEIQAESIELPHPLFYYYYRTLTWCICYSRWTNVDRLLLTEVHGQHSASLFVSYPFLQVLKNAVLRTHPYNSVQNSFPALKVLSVPPGHLLLPPDLFPVSVVFSFPQCHIVGIIPEHFQTGFC